MEKMECYQLDFWLTPEESEIRSLKEEIKAVKTSCDKVRKKLFAENGKLVKKTDELESRLSIIERNICHTK